MRVDSAYSRGLTRARHRCLCCGHALRKVPRPGRPFDRATAMGAERLESIRSIHWPPAVSWRAREIASEGLVRKSTRESCPGPLRYPGLDSSARRGPLDWEPGTSSCPLASVEEGNDRLTCTHRIAYQPHRHVRTCVHRALAEMLTRLAATPSDDARGRCQFKAARSASAARSVGGRGFAATECRPPTSDGHDRRAASDSTTGGGP